MSQDECIFCKIAQGQIPCAKLYETDTVLAFLDIAPVNKGHALVICKAHHETILDLPSELGCDLVEAMKTVGEAVMDATGSVGLNVMMNNFEAAGQLVEHAHFHLIPRTEDDGLSLWPQEAYEDQAEMDDLARAIREKIG